MDSFFFLRPTAKMARPMSARTTTTPTTMPIMAPVEMTAVTLSLEEWGVVVGEEDEGVGEPGMPELLDSDCQFSPGESE